MHAALDVLAFWEHNDMGERFQRKFATWADFLEDQGRQKGLAEGRQEGFQEGLHAVRGVLRNLLQRRFGPLSAPAAVRVDGASLDECERWLARAAEASAIDDVFRA
jgi:flagellar biosynthesis/type III secretory pathway protein FliH